LLAAYLQVELALWL